MFSTDESINTSFANRFSAPASQYVVPNTLFKVELQSNANIDFIEISQEAGDRHFTVHLGINSNKGLYIGERLSYAIRPTEENYEYLLKAARDGSKAVVSKKVFESLTLQRVNDFLSEMGRLNIISGPEVVKAKGEFKEMMPENMVAEAQCFAI